MGVSRCVSPSALLHDVTHCAEVTVPAASLHGPICINAAPPRSDKPVDAGLLTAPRRGFIDPWGLQPTCLSGLPLHQWGVVYWEVKVCVCHGGGVRIIVSSVPPLRHIRAY